MSLEKNGRIAVWSCGRVSSSRCPNKMVRPFADTTLTDIFLSKLAKLNIDVFFAGYEDIFKEKCNAHKVPFVKRTEKSANIDEPASEIYSFLKTQPFEYFLQVNACLPFLKIDTMKKYFDMCKENKEPSFAVIKKSNFFVKTDGTPINFSNNLTTINTKKVSPINEFAHAFYFFKKEYFIETGWYWDWNTIKYIEIPGGLEIFDIDEEEEFEMAEAIWQYKKYSIDNL